MQARRAFGSVCLPVCLGVTTTADLSDGSLLWSVPDAYAWGSPTPQLAEEILHSSLSLRSRVRTNLGSRRLLAALIGATAIACGNDVSAPPTDSTPTDANPDITAVTTSAAPWRVEDFSTYSGSTTTWKADPHDWMYAASSWMHQERIKLDTQVLYNGHPTLRYDWPGPAAGSPWGGCNTDPAILADYKAPSTREVWVEAVHKFRSDFNNKGPGCSSTAYKLLLLWRPIGDRYDIVNGVYGNWWSAAPQNPAYPVSTSSTGSWCSGYDSNCRWGYGPNQSQYLANVPGKQWDGLWHVYRVHIRISSCGTCADGIYEVWVDGKKVVGRYSMKNAKKDGTWSGRLSDIYLGSNSNSGTYSATQTWWGHLKIWTSNPGWL